MESRRVFFVAHVGRKSLLDDGYYMGCPAVSPLYFCRLRINVPLNKGEINPNLLHSGKRTAKSPWEKPHHFGWVIY